MLTEFYDEDNIARIGFVGNLELYINTDDVCSLPHFHICDRGTKGIIFHTTICLDDAVYFNSEEVAKQALKDVVELFMKKHPEFVW